MSKSIIEDGRTEGIKLSGEETARYSRHLMMPEVAADGQRRLKAAHVLCIGAGGLGSPAALYLAAAGVGKIGIVDFDDVYLSNLQRQILHGTKDVGRNKLESARDRLRDANPNVEVELHGCRFSSENASRLVARYDLVIDGSDNFPTRYLSNDVCVFARKPNVYGSVFRFDGQATVFAPHLGGLDAGVIARRIFEGRSVAARYPYPRGPFARGLALTDQAQRLASPLRIAPPRGAAHRAGAATATARPAADITTATTSDKAVSATSNPIGTPGW